MADDAPRLDPRAEQLLSLAAQSLVDLGATWLSNQVKDWVSAKKRIDGVKTYLRKPVEVQAWKLPHLPEDGDERTWALAELKAIASWCDGIVTVEGNNGQVRFGKTMPGHRAISGEYIVKDPGDRFTVQNAVMFENHHEPKS